MNLDKLIEKAIISKLTNSDLTTDEIWSVGKKYFIRTATMYNVGRLKIVTDKELVLENASWIGDTGRFHECLKNGKFSEVEDFISDVIVNRDSIIDATEWTHELPNKKNK